MKSVADSAVSSAVDAAEGAAVNGAKAAATATVKKSFFAATPVTELVKQGRANKTAEVILNMRSVSHITIKGPYASQLVRLYCQCFRPFYNGDLAEFDNLNFFEVERDPTQCGLFRFLWPRTRNVSTVRPLSEVNERIHTHIEAAVYDFFFSMQQKDHDLRKQKAETSNPVTLAALLIPRIVDVISSLDDTLLMSTLYRALTDFCKDLYPIMEGYYGRFWTKNKYIVDFISSIPDLIQSFSTESARSYNVPAIDTHMEPFFKNATVLAVESYNVLRTFVPSQGLRLDLTMPPAVGVRFDILHAKGPSVDLDAVIDSSETFSEEWLSQDKYITDTARRLIKYAKRTEKLVIRYIEYVYTIAKDVAVEEREREKSRLLESMINRLWKQCDFIKKVDPNKLDLYDLKALEKMMRSHVRFKKLSKKERKRHVRRLHDLVLPKLSRLFFKAAQYYRKQLLVENAIRALKFFAEDSKAAVTAPQVREFMVFLSQYYSDLKSFSQELRQLSADSIFYYSGIEHNARNLSRYANLIEIKSDEAISIKNDVTHKISLAEGHAHSKSSSSQFSDRTHLSSDAQKVFDIALQLLLAFDINFPQYSIEKLEKIREKIWGKYAWEMVQAYEGAVAFSNDNLDENELTRKCRALQMFKRQGNLRQSTQATRRGLRATRSFHRRDSYDINLRDGRMTQKIKKKIWMAQEQYEKFSLDERGRFNHFTGKHSDARIQDVKQWSEEFIEQANQVQQTINQQQFQINSDPKKTIETVYSKLIERIVMENKNKENHSFGYYLKMHFFEDNRMNEPFIQFYNKYRQENTQQAELEEVPKHRLRTMDSIVLSDESDIMSDTVIGSDSEGQGLRSESVAARKEQSDDEDDDTVTQRGSDSGTDGDDESSDYDSDVVESYAATKSSSPGSARVNRRRQEDCLPSNGSSVAQISNHWKSKSKRGGIAEEKKERADPLALRRASFDDGVAMKEDDARLDNTVERASLSPNQRRGGAGMTFINEKSSVRPKRGVRGEEKSEHLEAKQNFDQDQDHSRFPVSPPLAPVIKKPPPPASHLEIEDASKGEVSRQRQSSARRRSHRRGKSSSRRGSKKVSFHVSAQHERSASSSSSSSVALFGRSPSRGSKANVPSHPAKIPPGQELTTEGESKSREVHSDSDASACSETQGQTYLTLPRTSLSQASQSGKLRHGLSSSQLSML